METGYPTDPMATPPGSAEVHTRLTTTTEQGYASGTGGEQSRTEQAKDKARDVADQAKDRATEATDQARQKASELSSKAQEKLSGALSRAQEALDERGLLDTIRQNPLPALGLAFGAGFLLAGSDDSDRHGTMSKAKNQLKGAVMGGLSAAVAQEARSLVGMGGSKSSGGFLNSIIENLAGGSSGRSGRSGGGEPHRPPSHQEMR